MKTRGFNTETSRLARLQKENKSIVDQLNGIILTNQRLIKMNENLINQNRSLHEELQIQEKTVVEHKIAFHILDSIKCAYPKLYLHLLAASNNASHSSEHNNSFPEELTTWYLNYSSFGESIYSNLDNDFGFPSFRTIQRYKQKLLEQEGITKDLFNGSLESLQYLLSVCWAREDIPEVDHRCVLAVDAASVTPSLSIRKDVTVHGLIDEIEIEEAARKALAGGIDAFNQFVESNKGEICKYYFVCYINPLSPQRKPFPVLAIRRTTGSADAETIDIVNSLIFQIQSHFNNILELVGISFDGDPGWLHLIKPFLDQLPLLSPNLNEQEDFKQNYVQNLEELNHPLSSYGSEYGLLPFEDVLHLLKCGRYRIIKDDEFHSWPSLQQPDTTRADLHNLGIPEYILDDSRCKKMEDLYPLMMFNFKILEKIESQKPELIAVWTPLTLLAESIFNEDLSREDRINNLTNAFCMMWLYFDESKQQGINKSHCIYDTIFCTKFLSLCISLCTIIATPLGVHLGALGTHWLEHYFGQIRRLCKGDDSVDRVETSMCFTILQKRLSKSNIPVRIIPRKSRKSDSGCILKDEENPIKQQSIFSGVIYAYAIISFIHQFSNEHIIALVNPYLQELNQIDIARNEPETFAESKFHATSSLELKLQGGGGYTSMERMAAGSEITKFTGSH